MAYRAERDCRSDTDWQRAEVYQGTNREYFTARKQLAAIFRTQRRGFSGIRNFLLKNLSNVELFNEKNGFLYHHHIFAQRLLPACPGAAKICSGHLSRRL